MRLPGSADSMSRAQLLPQRPGPTPTLFSTSPLCSRSS